MDDYAYVVSYAFRNHSYEVHLSDISHLQSAARLAHDTCTPENSEN